MRLQCNAMRLHAIAMQYNPIAMQCDCDSMRLQCNAIATQCDCNNRIPFVAEYKLTEGPGGTRAKRNQPGEGPNPPKPRKHFLKKCERFLRRKTKKYAVLAMPPRRIPLPDSSPPGPRKTSLEQYPQIPTKLFLKNCERVLLENIKKNFGISDAPRHSSFLPIPCSPTLHTTSAFPQNHS